MMKMNRILGLSTMTESSAAYLENGVSKKIAGIIMVVKKTIINVSHLNNLVIKLFLESAALLLRVLFHQT